MDANFILRLASSSALIVGALLVTYLGALAFYCTILVIVICSYKEIFNITKDRMGLLKYIGYLSILIPNASLIYIYNYSKTICIWLILIIWISDSTAYLIGKNIGGPLLIPSISPKKTQVGFIGGILCSFLGGVSLVFTLKMHLSFILLAPVVAFIGVVGDLLESFFKRKCNVKESGNLIPGHGGVLDRFDSFILTAPFIAFLIYKTYI